MCGCVILEQVVFGVRPRRLWSDICLFCFFLLPEKSKNNQSGGEGSHCGGLKQEKKRVYHPSEEMWLADMDAEMNGTSCDNIVIGDLILA